MPRRNKAVKSGSSPASYSVLEFDLHTGKQRYSGTVNVPDWDETCTLPMMVNSLMVNLAKDCPEIHEADQMVFNCKLSKPNVSTVATEGAGKSPTEAAQHPNQD